MQKASKTTIVNRHKAESVGNKSHLQKIVDTLFFQRSLELLNPVNIFIDICYIILGRVDTTPNARLFG